jgi:hypothetical protein
MASTSLTVMVGVTVTGSFTTPASWRFTRATREACCSMS